jgi:hypothetical protein
MLETNSSTLAKVMPRWQQLEKELERLAYVTGHGPSAAASGVNSFTTAPTGQKAQE